MSGTDHGVTIANYGASPSAAATTNSSAVSSALMSLPRQEPPPNPLLNGWGQGTVTVPAGNFETAPVSFPLSQLGFRIAGQSPYASNLIFRQSTGALMTLRTYVHGVLEGMYWRNEGATGDSVALKLESQGGAGMLALKRLAIDGFHTAIKLDGRDGHRVDNDKTLVEQVEFGGKVGFDSSYNTQAIGWSFINCAGGCQETHFRHSGGGSLYVVNYTSDIYQSLLELPEGSGSPICQMKFETTKLEYHGTGNRYLVDARKSLANVDGGGTSTNVVLDQVTLLQGATPPAPGSNAVIQIGAEVDAASVPVSQPGTGSWRGSDGINIHARNGKFEGVVRLGSHVNSTRDRRIIFDDMQLAPSPDMLELKGSGTHHLVGWRGCSNIPDQYRGGEAFNGSLPSELALFWTHSVRSIINTGETGGRLAIGGRSGFDFNIAVPKGAVITGLDLLVRDVGQLGGSDLTFELWNSAANRAANGSAGRLVAQTIPHATLAGNVPLIPVPLGQRHRSTDGTLYIRATLDGVAKALGGQIVVRYFPMII